MNKIFKVVWNRTIQSFVVTSELAKGRVKSSAEQNSADVSTKSGKNGIATVFRLTVISAALLGAGNSYAATAARVQMPRLLKIMLLRWVQIQVQVVQMQQR